MMMRAALRPIALWLLLLLALFASGCDALERLESSYGSLAEAMADGAITRGWLPADLPPSATAIREWHDLDTNRGFGTLRFGSSDDGWVHEHWQAVADTRPLNVRHQWGDPVWWPNELQGRVDTAGLRQANWSFYTTGSFYLAVQWDSRTLYFWQARS
jgi:hypothetical protein